MKKIRIFTASPSDMASERAKIQTVATLLQPLADAFDITLQIIDWKLVVPNMGRPEQVILDELKPGTWDMFIGIIWHRFGTPPGAVDPITKKEYLSGTEEEFHFAYNLWKKYKKPRIIFYRCMRPIPIDVLDPEQYRLVIEFFAKFDGRKGEHPGLYQPFETISSFEKMLLNNLQKLLLEYREYAKGKPVSPEVFQVYAPKIPDNLPRRVNFFGREKEIMQVMQSLSPEDRTWGMLIDGIGGIGKTALAIEAAYVAKEKGLFDSFVFITAKGTRLTFTGIQKETPAARTVDEFLNQTAKILGQIGIAKLARIEKRAALLDALRSTRTLLIYDNLETLSKEEQEALAEFLRELPPGCKAIITSRRRGGEGAVWLRLEKLDWNAAQAIIESEITHDAHLAQKMRKINKERWIELYEETYGSPLALVHVLGLMRIRSSLSFDGVISMLKGVEKDNALQEFVYQEALKELTANDKIALTSLSLFDPSARFDEWKEITHLSRNGLESAIDRLSALSLLDISLGEEFYSLHPLTKSFVYRNLLLEDREKEKMVIEFADYWNKNYILKWCGRAGKNLSYLKIEPYWTNISSAVEALWRIADKAEGATQIEATGLYKRMVFSIRLFLALTGRMDELIILFERSYELSIREKDNIAAGWFAYYLSEQFYYQYQTADAVKWVDNCETNWKHILEDQKSIRKGAFLSIKGQIAQQMKNYKEAEVLLKNAFTIAFSLDGHFAEKASSLNRLGTLAYDQKQYKVALEFYLQALEIATKKADTKRIVSYTANLGRTLYDMDDLDNSYARLYEILPLTRKNQLISSLSDVLDILARISKKRGNPPDALAYAQEALVIRKGLRHKELSKTQELLNEINQPT